MPRARYDGVADWYDKFATVGAISYVTELAGDLARMVLGEGRGACLDLACGGGVHASAIEDLGWHVVGVDISLDQLCVARQRDATVVLADAARLPFASGALDAVATIMSMTDFEDLAAVVGEACRVLVPGGRLALIASHPCFGGAFIEEHEDGSVRVHRGYRQHAWVDSHRLLGDGIRSRVGTANIPLAVLFEIVIGAGFTIERVLEDDGTRAVPNLLAIRASRPAN